MRTLPPDVVIDPMPGGWTANITVMPDGRRLKWSAQVRTPDGLLQVEYALHLPDGSPDAMTRTIEKVKATAWQTTELARIGRVDLLTYVRADRHAQRPGRGRALTPEATQLLANVQAAHAARG